MEVLRFLFVSALEWLAFLVLMFVLFRFQFRGYRGQIVFTSFLLSLLSYILFVTLDLTLLATLIQPPVIFLFLWQMFRVPVFYAGLMVVNGYLGYGVLQGIILLSFEQFGFTIEPNTLPSFILQTLTACLVFVLVWILHKYRIGFTFVPDSERASVKLTGINLRLFLLTLFGYIVVASFNSLFYGYLANYTAILLLIVIIAFGLLQYWIFKKEYADD